MRAFFFVIAVAALSTVACDRLDFRPTAQAVGDGSADSASEATAASDYPTEPAADVGIPQGDVWLPGPGQSVGNVAVSDDPPVPAADIGIPRGDIWPPGPSPSAQVVAEADEPPVPEADTDIPEGDVTPPGPGPGE